MDAPVSGGTAGAKSSKLAIMVGGEKKIFNKTKNLFKTMGKATYVGKYEGPQGCNYIPIEKRK